jgi:predicted nucleotidyltransferase
MRKPAKQEIANICRKYRIEFLALFGSRASGEAKNESDIDLAVFFSRLISAREELDFFYELVRLFETDQLDLVVLDRANPLLLKEVALYGVPLYERYKTAFDKFIMLAMAKYQESRKNRSFEKELVEEFLEGKRREAI